MFLANFKTFIGLFCSIPIIRTKSEAKLLCFENPDSFHMIYCDSNYQKCCDTGCCDFAEEPSLYTWVPIVFGRIVPAIIGIVIICVLGLWIYRYSRKHCQKATPRRTTRHHEVSSTRLNPVEMRVEDNSRPPEIGFSVLPNQHNESGSGVPDGHNGSHVPVTPPPAYNVAIFSPSPNPTNRIPSYEDVTTGKKA